MGVIKLLILVHYVIILFIINNFHNIINYLFINIKNNEIENIN
jgi:hypothetical protein